MFKKAPKGIDQILAIKDTDEKIIALHGFCNQHYENGTKTEKVINAVLDLEAEVMNGGFHQYFYNSAGNQWRDTLIGLNKICASKTMNLLVKALTVFKDSSPSITWEERQQTTSTLSTEQLEFLDTLDQEFYKFEDDISSLIVAYAETNRSDFGKN